MIFDSLIRFRDYLGVHPLFARVADFIEATDLAALAECRHEIDAEGCFALVSEYRTLAPGEGFIECHRRHIDIQILVSGVEQIGVCRRGECTATSWDEAGDFEVLEGDVDWITLRPGSFAIFLPQDGHMPKIRHGDATTVRKVVIKVPVAPAGLLPVKDVGGSLKDYAGKAPVPFRRARDKAWEDVAREKARRADT